MHMMATSSSVLHLTFRNTFRISACVFPFVPFKHQGHHCRLLWCCRAYNRMTCIEKAPHSHLQCSDTYILVYALRLLGMRG